MNLETGVFNNLMDIGRSAYEPFHRMVDAPVFYSWEFLTAIEASPLLPTLKIFYIVVRHADDIVGFLPLYLQENVDPFNVLSQATHHTFLADSQALFSHIMHVSDARILASNLFKKPIMKALLNCLRTLQEKENVEFGGILNIDMTGLEDTLDLFEEQNYAIYPMWNRYRVDISRYTHLDDIIAHLPSHGRREVNRQLRKYHASHSMVAWKNIRDVDVTAVVDMIHQTTLKYGTGDYYPKQALARFLMHCADIATVIEIQFAGQRVGVGIVFLDGDTVHLWAIGVNYSLTEYSPYTILYVHLYQYALDHNYQIIEAGRTTQAIKERLGFSAVPLQAILNYQS